MRIIHLSTSDISGGAARAAHRVHTGLRRLGCESYMLVAWRESDDPNVIAFRPPMDLPSRLRRRLRREQITRSFARYRRSRPADSVRFSDDRSQHGADILGQLPPGDVITLHWVAGLVDYRAFFAAVPQHIPVVWRLADMNAFTGGCHLSYGCDKYAERCGACPQLGSSDPDDLSRQIWRRKREAFKQIDPDRLQIVTTSRWMAEQVTRSSLLGSFTVTIVPNSLDSDDFAPRNRSFARDTLGIPREARVVLFVAVSIAKRHKGFALLVQALAGLVDQSNLLLVSVGGGKPALDIPLPHLHLGYIENERLLSLVYSAADVFVMPSRQESFGQTAIEALACGIPVVGFAIGGIPDIVRPGVTGLLVPAGDVAALRSAIAQLLQDQTLRDEMSANCRRIAVEEYTLEVQARRYLELYETLLAPN